MSNKLKMYFAHPVNIFKTNFKQYLITEIEFNFLLHQIEDPEDKKHQKGYEEEKQSSGNGMKYYTEKVLPDCDACVFLPFRDGKIGKGVAKEIKYFLKNNKPVYEINFQTLKIKEITSIEEDRILTIPETIKRIRDKKGNTIPY